MRMDDISTFRLQMSKRDTGPRKREDGKPQPVVRMILPVRPKIRPAGAIKKLWDFEDQEVETVERGLGNTAFKSQQIAQCAHIGSALQRLRTCG